MVDVGVGTPDVSALPDGPAEAPAKAADWVLAAGSGMADVALGLSTLMGVSVDVSGGKDGICWGKERDLLVNDMDDTVGNENVGGNHFGAVDEDVVAVDGNCEVVTSERLD